MSLRILEEALTTGLSGQRHILPFLDAAKIVLSNEGISLPSRPDDIDSIVSGRDSSRVDFARMTYVLAREVCRLRVVGTFPEDEERH